METGGWECRRPQGGQGCLLGFAGTRWGAMGRDMCNTFLRGEAPAHVGYPYPTFLRLRRPTCTWARSTRSCVLSFWLNHP